MPSILEIYASAIYEVYNPQMILHVGETSETLDTLLSKHNKQSWAFITPYNPYPLTLSDEENQERLAELQTMVAVYPTYLGEGRGDSENPCTPEKSILILGISLDEGQRIGRYFSQKAILAGKYGQSVELVDLSY